MNSGAGLYLQNHPVTRLDYVDMPQEILAKQGIISLIHLSYHAHAQAPEL